MHFDIRKVIGIITLIMRAEDVITAKGPAKKAKVLEGVKIGKAGIALSKPELADTIERFVDLAVEIAQAHDPEASS